MKMRLRCLSSHVCEPGQARKRDQIRPTDFAVPRPCARAPIYLQSTGQELRPTGRAGSPGCTPDLQPAFPRAGRRMCRMSPRNRHIRSPEPSARDPVPCLPGLFPNSPSPRNIHKASSRDSKWVPTNKGYPTTDSKATRGKGPTRTSGSLSSTADSRNNTDDNPSRGNRDGSKAGSPGCKDDTRSPEAGNPDHDPGHRAGNRNRAHDAPHKTFPCLPGTR